MPYQLTGESKAGLSLNGQQQDGRPLFYGYLQGFHPYLYWLRVKILNRWISLTQKCISPLSFTGEPSGVSPCSVIGSQSLNILFVRSTRVPHTSLLDYCWRYQAIARDQWYWAYASRPKPPFFLINDNGSPQEWLKDFVLYSMKSFQTLNL